MLVTYWKHSGFSVQTDGLTLLFDYIGGGFIKPAGDTVAFVSHSHSDHWMPGVEKLADFLVKDMAEGGETDVCGAHIRAFGSTDEGVSYLVSVPGARIFHAGDLNLWHWKDESTPDEISKAESDYERIIKTIEGEKIDLAFFPVDPRMGTDYDAGARIFMERVQPKILIPMHFWDNPRAAADFAAKYGNVIALTRQGQSVEI